MKRFFSFLVMGLASFGASVFGAEIIFWHAFEGFLEEKFQEIVDDFNHQSKAYQIKLVYKGNYKETYEQGVAAFDQGNPPPHSSSL